MFDLVNEIIGGEEAALSEVAEEFVRRQAERGIGYTEVRYDPVRPSSSHIGNVSISEEATIRAVEVGLRAGSERHGVEVHQLLCAMRGSPGAACFDLAQLAARVRSGKMGGVVGIDLAGDEFHYNNSVGQVIACFAYAKSTLLLNTTVHAGEMAGAADVRLAVAEMLADRVGHGYSSVDDMGVVELLKAQRVPLEACPAGHHHNLAATGRYHALGLNFGLSTDDPAPYFANVSMVDVEALVRSQLGFTNSDLRDAHGRAFEARFAPHASRLAALIQQRQPGQQQPPSPPPGNTQGKESLGLAAAAGALCAGAVCVLALWRYTVHCHRLTDGRGKRHDRASKAAAALDMGPFEKMHDEEA